MASDSVQFANLVQMFSESAKKYADRQLFGTKRGSEWRWMTYGQVAERVDGFRGGLASIGVAAGDRVAIISNNRPEWAIAAYATYSRGAQFVPMYEAQLAKEWKFILNDCGAKVLIVANDEIYAKTKDFPAEVETLEVVVNMAARTAEPTSFYGLIEAGKDAPVDAVEPDPSDVCGFIYTSGTTGNPKGVLLSHRNLASNVNAVHALFPMEDARSLSFLPWAHSFGQTCELHSMVSYGAAIGIAESVPKIIENLAEVQPTVLFSVPRIFNRIYDGVNQKMTEAGGLKKKLFDRTMKVGNARRNLAERGKKSLLLDLQYKVLDKLVGAKVRERFGGRLQYAFSGGAALAKEVGEFVDNLGITVYEGYGLTETSPILTANSPLGRKIGSVGRPIPGCEVFIVPIDSAPAGEGEICARGPNIMVGYHNLDAETAKVLDEDGTFHTGDMGRIDDDGFVWITGRVKEQYKLENGKYVVPAPLEEKLKLSPFIANAMIYGMNRPHNVAIIVPDFEVLTKWATSKGVSGGPEQLVTAGPVRALLEEQLAEYGASFKGYERPRKFALVASDFTTENGMLTPTLKLKRRIVIEHYKGEIDSLYGG